MELENQIKDIVDKCNESQTALKMMQSDIPNLDQGITQIEAIKYHVRNMNNLVPLNFIRFKITICLTLTS